MMEAQVHSRSSKKRTKWFDAECDVAALPKHTKTIVNPALQQQVGV